MARHGRVSPARSSRNAEALLVRSAESLGRIIGSLQRELESVGLPLNEDAATGGRSDRSAHRQNAARGRNTRTAGAGTGALRARRPSASKVRATADRTSRREAKPGVVKKSTARQSGARNARKSPRRG